MSNQSNMPPCILSAWKLHESELHHWLLRQLGNQEFDKHDSAYIDEILTEIHSHLGMHTVLSQSSQGVMVNRACFFETSSLQV